MTTKMTERDKKLLTGLAVFGVIALFAMFAILPLHHANVYMRRQIQQLEQKKTEMDQKLLMLPAARIEHDDLIKQIKDQQQNFYPLMSSQGVDRILTGIAGELNLEIRKLNIKMPQDSLTLPAYGMGEKEENTVIGIYAADVSLEVSGGQENMQKIIDLFANDYPAIRLTNLNWSTESGSRRNGNESYDILSLNLELYMCEKDE